jgi:hypothetical protein
VLSESFTLFGMQPTHYATQQSIPSKLCQHLLKAALAS